MLVDPFQKGEENISNLLSYKLNIINVEQHPDQFLRISQRLLHESCDSNLFSIYLPKIDHQLYF